MGLNNFMPIDPVYFGISLIKVVLSASIPVMAGIFVDSQLLQNTNFLGIATLLGVILAGICLIMTTEKVSLGIKKHLAKKIPTKLE